MEKDLWQSLKYVYLKDTEISEYALDETRRIDMINLIKKRMFDEIWQRMNRSGEDKPPFLTCLNSKFLLEDRKVQIIESDEIKWAKTEVKGTKFLIYINKYINLKQKRTLLAHEVGHTFLYDTEKIPIAPYYTAGGPGHFFVSISSNLYNYHEGFAYEIGRHILIPSSVLNELVPKNPTIEDFFVACATFNTTKDVMARRLFWDIHDWNSKYNYWSDSVLIIYPINKNLIDRSKHSKSSKKNRDIYPKPRGNMEVFRGKFFKYFDVESIWDLLLLFVDASFDLPNHVIRSNDKKLIDYIKKKNDREILNLYKLMYKKIALKFELVYKPQGDNIFIIITKNK